MRTQITAIITIAISSILYYAYITPSPLITSPKVSIAASPEAVFNAIADFERWHEWTTIYRDIKPYDLNSEGKVVPRSKVGFTTNEPGMPSVPNVAVLDVVKGPHTKHDGGVDADAQAGLHTSVYKYKMSWYGGPPLPGVTPWIMGGHHWWVICEDGEGGAMLEHGEQLVGVAKWLVSEEMRGDIGKMLVKFNGALKERVEGVSRGESK
jgi:hypothetical protein